MLVSYICTFALDPAESESEFQAEQDQGVFGGPQASCCEDTNIALDQGKPRCIQLLLFAFYFESCFIL
jgi:hypothetical protein